MTNKMTNKNALSFVLNNCEMPVDVREKLETMLAQLEKKSSNDRKPTPTQLANEALKTAIINSMETGAQYTISDMIKTFPELSELSNQKVSAIVRGMVEAGTVVKTTEKRKSYFSKVEGV